MEDVGAGKQSPNHNPAVAGKSSMVGELGGISSDPPDVAGQDNAYHDVTSNAKVCMDQEREQLFSPPLDDDAVNDDQANDDS